MLLVGTAPEGGEDVMHLEKPELSRILGDPSLKGYQTLVKLFFTLSEASQAAGQAFASRLMARTEDREPVSGPNVPQAQTPRSGHGSGWRASASPGCAGSRSRAWW
jgi:hypothetical protein